MNLVLRPLQEILEAAREEALGHPELSSAGREELHRVAGEANLQILLALNGYEHSADCVWQLDSVGQFAATMFADELGPDAPYSIIAWSGCGDAWALDRRSAKVTFLNHDGWDSSGEHAMEVPLNVDLVAFIGIAEAWAATEGLIEEDEASQDAATEAFLEYLRSIDGIVAENWPYC